MKKQLAEIAKERAPKTILSAPSSRARTPASGAQKKRCISVTKANEKYEGDLEFLNRLKPAQIATLTGNFKSAGRQTERQAQKEKDRGMFEPTMGSYDVKFCAVRVEKSQQLVMMQPEHSSEG